MQRLFVPILAVLSLGGAAWAQADNGTTVAASSKDRNGCNVVERKSDGNSPSGSMSSSVTAGGGKVSGSTTGSGNSVTVHSGNGTTSSSAATAGSSGGSTVVAGSSNGDCTIYVDPGKQNSKERRNK